MPRAAKGMLDTKRIRTLAQGVGAGSRSYWPKAGDLTYDPRFK